MSVISMKQLLEAGVHFGHQTRRWNPKMKRFIFTERNGIYIIDLQKTVKKVEEAYFFMRDVAMDGKPILFVGTKKQAQESIETEAKRCGQFYVSNRWLGGMLTNFKTIRSRISRLNHIEKMEETGDIDLLPKKEVIKLMHEKEKLEKNLGGITQHAGYCRELCSLSIREKSTLPLLKHMRWAFRLWQSLIPTAILTRSIIPFPETTMQSVRSS